MSWITTQAPAMPTDFLIEVGKGNVPGHRIDVKLGFSPNIGTVSPTQVWGGTSDMIYPTAAETWEIVSTSANDTIAVGSGAQVVLVNSLDENYLEQSQIVFLNGTTPVTLAGTHIRPAGAVVVGSGATQGNEGDIVISDTITGNPRQYILQGKAGSQDSHYTCPDGKSILSLKNIFSVNKDSDFTAGGVLIPPGTNTKIQVGLFNFYQNLINFDQRGEFLLQSRTDFFNQAISSNPNTQFNGVLVALVIDNDAL